MEWIKVEDELPNNENEVLTFCFDCCTVGFLRNGVWELDCDLEPSHWMPLPEPPNN